MVAPAAWGRPAWCSSSRATRSPGSRTTASTEPGGVPRPDRGPVVAVVGAGDADSHLEELAHEVGRLLAEAGCTVVCGGLGGVMQAACRGAKSAGGRTIGILPGASSREANPYVDVAVATGMGQARNAIIVRTADAVVAVGGGYGTLSEIALTLRAGKPLVGLQTWEASVGGRQADIIRVTTPEEAIRAILPGA